VTVVEVALMAEGVMEASMVGAAKGVVVMVVGMAVGMVVVAKATRSLYPPAPMAVVVEAVVVQEAVMAVMAVVRHMHLDPQAKAC
jgi:hypothetical protein